MFSRLMQYIKRNFPSNNSPLVQLSLFHDKRGPVWSTLKLITDQLKKEKIDYAVIGGLAVYEHGYQRSTHDCDILLTKIGLQHFQEKFVGRYVKPKFVGAKKKFICNNTKTPIDIIVQGEYPGDGKEVPVQFPDPKTSYQFIDGYNIISLPKLIELKLTSYKRLPAVRSQDKTDVIQLIQIKNLDKSFADLLHPYVQNDFKDAIDDLERDKKQKGEADEM